MTLRGGIRLGWKANTQRPTPNTQHHGIGAVWPGPEPEGLRPMPHTLTPSGVFVVSGRARALRSVTVFLKRDRTARAVLLTPSEPKKVALGLRGLNRQPARASVRASPLMSI
ncbi:hypothetical protein Enr13x_00380 [Stieleria neptunia]|uniref:Uncharacterized protein n=1 Tax=Stieleria neptunia TaxID=2527979 RepID=A0A518HHC3_9BACT|nr:hypothetical protein Enr13x_00380 [Stieleria neptunia]